MGRAGRRCAGHLHFVSLGAAAGKIESGIILAVNFGENTWSELSLLLKSADIILFIFNMYKTLFNILQYYEKGC